MYQPLQAVGRVGLRAAARAMKEEDAIKLLKFQCVVLRMRDSAREDRAGSLGSKPCDDDRRRYRRCVGMQVHEPRRGGPEKGTCSGCPRFHRSRRQQSVDRQGESDGHPAWCLARGACNKDGPATWESLVFPRSNPVSRGAGDPSPKRRALACARDDARRSSARTRGRPKARETIAEVNGNEASEDCIRAMTSGNGRHPDPIEQRRSVSSLNLRKEPCLLHR
jgi:hypothetical protein